jgi:nucleoid DNA-binding protein
MGKSVLNQNDLIGAVQKVHPELAKWHVKQIIDHYIASLTAAVEVLEPGECLKTPFGVFKASDRKARKARNPATGEVVDVPAKRVVKFKVAKGLK